MLQEKASRRDQIILAVSVLLFAGIYLTGFVMGLAETARRSAHVEAAHKASGTGRTGPAAKEPSQR